MAEGLHPGLPEPQDAAMERAVLGAVFLDPQSVHRIQEAGLAAEDFYGEGHRILFDAILAVSREGHLPDVKMVQSYVKDRRKLQQVGGVQYLLQLMEMVPAVANLQEYVRQVQEKATLRRLLSTAQSIVTQVHSGEGGAAAALELAEKEILALGEAQHHRSFFPLNEVVADVLKEIQDRFENPSDVTGITTGFKDLDAKLAGLQRSDLIILAARPSMGKTAFSLNVIASAALLGNASVAFFSLEMAKEQLATRLLASESRVDGGRLRTGKLRQDDLPALMEGGERLEQAKIHIDDTANISLSELRSKCRRLKLEKSLDLIVVDYLQLMKADRSELSSNASREQEISSISRGLKGLAKDLNVPVIALSQLNRGVEQRADKRPMLSDLRESGAIEQDADVIIFLYRDEVYNPNTEHKGVAEVLIRKQRSGPIGDVHLAWRSEFTRFENLAGDGW